MAWRFSSDRAENALEVREAFLNAVQGLHGKVDDFTVRLIFTELVANVIRHAPGPIEISLDGAEDNLWLHVTDSGPPFEWRPLIPDISAERGRGLFLVLQCAQAVSLERTPEGNVVHVQLDTSAGRGATIERRNRSSFEDECVLQSKRQEHSR